MTARIVSLVNHKDQLWFMSENNQTKHKLTSSNINLLYSKLIKLIEVIDLEKIPISLNDKKNISIRKKYSGKILVCKNDNSKYWYVEPSSLTRKELAFFDLLEIIYLMSTPMTVKQLEIIPDGV